MYEATDRHGSTAAKSSDAARKRPSTCDPNSKNPEAAAATAAGRVDPGARFTAARRRAGACADARRERRERRYKPGSPASAQCRAMYHCRRVAAELPPPPPCALGRG